MKWQLASCRVLRAIKFLPSIAIARETLLSNCFRERERERVAVAINSEVKREGSHNFLNCHSLSLSFDELNEEATAAHRHLPRYQASESNSK
jgi:hypothetical protein